MKKLFFILPLLALVACGTKQENTGDEKSESEHLSFWWQKHDSIDHAFVMTAEPLWLFGRNGEDIYDWNYQLDWFNGCRQVLVNTYDSIHPGTRTKDKDLLMLDELIQFFETEPDYSTMGMIIAYDLEENFVMYKTIAYSKAMLSWRNKRAGLAEINAWNNLHRLLNKFCVNMLYLGWYGGSGAGPACTALTGNISNRRLEDVERLNRFYHNELPSSELLCKDTLNIPFEAAVDSVIKNRKLSPEVREWYTKSEIAGYEKVFNEAVTYRDSLIDAYYNWRSIRDRLMGSDHNDSRKDIMISDVRHLVLIAGED